jgi:2-oxoisovalerate dehydrogenase E2 component (dihydrolipoyl transacylase)
VGVNSLATEKITMPQLGESVTDGSISRWIVDIGDKVNKYDPVAEIITDKVTAEVPSSFTGVIKEILAYEGDTLLVGEAMCTIETEESSQAKEVETVLEEKDTAKKEAVQEGAAKLRYSPAVLKLSQEHNLDLATIQGTGAGGRITRKDVLKAIENRETEEVYKEAAPSSDIQEVEEVPETLPKTITYGTIPDIPLEQGDIEVPVRGIRKAIADHMIVSKHEIPHAWMLLEVDVTNLMKYRNSIKDEFKKKEGYNLTPFAFFVKAVAQALKEYPEVNAMWAGDKIIRKKDVNLSIAVATDDAVFTPVIKHADDKTIKGIARDIHELALKVRNGKLTMEDLSGGTFTVNNTGTIGSVQSMGIINHPQAAILQVESIIKRPVVINDMIAIREMVNLCLSLDHRILDGYICGKFMHKIKDTLENISKENTPIY